MLHVNHKTVYETMTHAQQITVWVIVAAGIVRLAFRKKFNHWAELRSHKNYSPEYVEAKLYELVKRFTDENNIEIIDTEFRYRPTKSEDKTESDISVIDISTTSFGPPRVLNFLCFHKTGKTEIWAWSVENRNGMYVRDKLNDVLAIVKDINNKYEIQAQAKIQMKKNKHLNNYSTRTGRRAA